MREKYLSMHFQPKIKKATALRVKKVRQVKKVGLLELALGFDLVGPFFAIKNFNQSINLIKLSITEDHRLQKKMRIG